MVFAMGPGDILTSFQQWLGGDKLGGAPSLTYTAQTLDFCKEHQCAAWLISSYGDGKIQETDLLRIENRPKPQVGQGGLSYHWQQWLYCLSLVRSARAFKAAHLVVDSGTTHWFMLFIAVWCGIEVHVSFHNTYYTVGRWQTTFSKSIIRWFDGLFFRWGSASALGVSHECGKQYVELGGSSNQFYLYNAQFRAEDFCDFKPRQGKSDGFHLLYVGRLEVDKGVIDLLTAVKQVMDAHPNRALLVSYCGGGAARALIEQALQRSPELMGRVRLLGHLNREALLQAYHHCDVVVVPTTGGFMEGFPKVAAEAMLCRRPLIISDAVPTIPGLMNASLVYRADDSADLARVIQSLWMDPGLYHRLARCTETIAPTFTDPSKGLCVALARAVFAA